MSPLDPAILDTLAFSGLDETEMQRRAVLSREGIDLFKHEMSYVRRRIIMNSTELPGLIVLPDGPATLESYDAFIEELSDRFNIAILEVPGFGFSYALSPDALEFDATCHILSAAIDDLKLRQAVVVGACVQGLIAARIVEINPTLLSGLIIAQTADFENEIEWANKAIDTHGNLARPFEGQIGFRLARERATVDWWTPLVAGPKLQLQEFQAEARKVLRCGCSFALASQIQKCNTTTPPPVLCPSIPTTVIWGNADVSHTHTDKRSILHCVPGAEYIERDDLGHFPDLEDPELIARVAKKLLRD